MGGRICTHNLPDLLFSNWRLFLSGNRLNFVLLVAFVALGFSLIDIDILLFTSIVNSSVDSFGEASEVVLFVFGLYVVDFNGRIVSFTFLLICFKIRTLIGFVTLLNLHKGGIIINWVVMAVGSLAISSLFTINSLAVRSLV